MPCIHSIIHSVIHSPIRSFPRHASQGALVSVSGGSYRRNQLSGADGALSFSSLAPGEYYVKPLMKEYKFSPPHTLLSVASGATQTRKLR